MASGLSAPTSNGFLNQTTLLRIKRDLTEFFKENMQEIFVVPSENDLSCVHAVIVGPKDTPYEGGYFYFEVTFTSEYPIKPPKVLLKTTGGGNVRFNPNLYANGKVCLSILGTWAGPPWSPVLNLTTVLLSIQSLMNEEPFYNEPGYESFRNANKDKFVTQSRNYNEVIQHQTIKYAVIEMLKGGGDGEKMPRPLREAMETHFRKNLNTLQQRIIKLTSKVGPFNDAHFSNKGSFEYPKLLEELSNLKSQFNINDNGDNAVSTSTTAAYGQVMSEFDESKEQFEEKEQQKYNVEDIIEEADYFNVESDGDDDDIMTID